MNTKLKLLAQADEMRDLQSYIDRDIYSRHNACTCGQCGACEICLIYVHARNREKELRQAASALVEKQEPVAIGERLWLWKNFENGVPEYWAFDNAYPTYAGGGPMTLGSPCGYALVRPSTNGKPHASQEDVIEEVKRALAHSSPPSIPQEVVEALRGARMSLSLSEYCSDQGIVISIDELLSKYGA